MSVEVLVVDDDAGIRRMIAAVLEDEGYRVRLADHGREALDRIAEHPPQLVVLDLQMPVMSGWELHEQLRACHRGPRPGDMVRTATSPSRSTSPPCCG